MIPFLNPIYLLQLDFNEKGELDDHEIEEAMMDLRIRIENQGGTWGHEGQRLDADIVIMAAKRLLDPVQRPFFCALQNKPELLAFLEGKSTALIDPRLHMPQADMPLYTFFRHDLLRAWSRLLDKTLRQYDWEGCYGLLYCPDWMDEEDHLAALKPMQQAFDAGYEYWGRVATAKAKNIPALLNSPYLSWDLTKLVDAFPTEKMEFRMQWAEQLLKAADQLHRHEFHAEAFKALHQVRLMDLEDAFQRHVDAVYGRLNGDAPALDQPAPPKTAKEKIIYAWREWLFPVGATVLFIVVCWEAC
jgi:hypothetical protein